jgi:hypothetical protein
MDIYMCCFIATLGAVGNFLLHASMEQIRVFVAKSTLSRMRTFLVFIGLGFYSDFTQILLRYLSQKMTGKASALL